MAKIRIAICWLFLAMLAWLAPNDAGAAPVRLALQKTGTVAWELDVMRRHGLDKRADLVVVAIEQASPEAGKIALRGGAADVIVSDWLWVSRERSLGFKLGNNVVVFLLDPDDAFCRAHHGHGRLHAAQKGLCMVMQQLFVLVE